MFDCLPIHVTNACDGIFNPNTFTRQSKASYLQSKSQKKKKYFHVDLSPTCERKKRAVHSPFLSYRFFFIFLHFFLLFISLPRFYVPDFNIQPEAFGHSSFSFFLYFKTSENTWIANLYIRLFNNKFFVPKL